MVSYPGKDTYTWPLSLTLKKFCRGSERMSWQDNGRTQIDVSLHGRVHTCLSTCTTALPLKYFARLCALYICWARLQTRNIIKNFVTILEELQTRSFVRMHLDLLQASKQESKQGSKFLSSVCKICKFSIVLVGLPMNARVIGAPIPK